jgi:hypothetical protein
MFSVTFEFPLGCKVMVEAAIRLPSLANQLVVTTRRVQLVWPAPDAAWPCYCSRASTARCAAPQAGLNRSDLGRHYD